MRAHLLSATLLLVGCGRAAPHDRENETVAPSAAEAPSASAPPASLCRPGEARCVGVDKAERCDDDGQAWALSVCAEGSACLSGACVSLSLDEAAQLDRTKLFAVRGEGFLNGWSRTSALSARSVEQLPAGAAALFAPGLSLGWKASCSPSGFVEPQSSRDSRNPILPYRLLSGVLIASRARTVRMLWGARGNITVRLGEKEVVRADRAGAEPFIDEAEALVALPEGATRIVVVMEQPDPRTTGFWLRLREMDHSPPGDLAFAFPPGTAGCALSELTDLNEVPSVIPQGFSFDLAPRFRGLSPLAEARVDYRAELTQGGAKATLLLAEGALSVSEMIEGEAHVPFVVKPSKAGKKTLRFTLGQGSAPRTHSVLYRGALHERVASLGEARPLYAKSRLSQASRESLEKHITTLEEALAENHSDEGWLSGLAADAEKLVKSVREGKDPYRDKTGVVFRAYRSDLDGTLQGYPVYVPRSYRPDGPPKPLIIAAHGLNQPPEIALRTVIGEAPDATMNRAWAARHLPGFPDYGTFLAAPRTYENAGPRLLGEQDVLRVIEEMRKSYRIDDARISITGYSLGGTVAFAVPFHYPDRFSASAPLCGYPNLATYDSVRSVPHTPWEETMIARRYLENYAENGLFLPLNVIHGALDGPGRSAVIVSRYKELGYSASFEVPDDLGHNVWDHGYKDGNMVAWLRGKKRPTAPRHVRLKTGELRYGEAYWVRLLAAEGGVFSSSADGPTELSSIDAEWRPSEDEVAVTTAHVRAFSLDLRPLFVPEGARVVIDQAPLPIPPAIRELYFEKQADGWTVSTAPPSLAGKKRAGVSGPLDDVLGHRQLIVYGTLDPAMTEANRLVAEHFSSDDQWKGAHYPIKADIDVRPEDLSGQSLVLIGRPSSNAVTASFAASLPVRFEQAALSLRGERYEGPDVGISLIYPHPRDPDEYVVLHAGVSPRAVLASRHLPQLAPDFLIYDRGITGESGGLLLGDRSVLAGGFFDEGWK